MDKGAQEDKRKLFLKRARHFNLSFILSLSVFLLVSVALYRFFSMPVSPKLLVYVYAIEVASALLGYGIAFAVRKTMLPVRVSGDAYWSYTAVRRYFWSYVVLCLPFFLAFLFYLFAGNLSSLLLGYVLSVAGLVAFRPREGDVVL